MSIHKCALDDKIPESEILVFEIDCWHHLRNIWIDEMTKRLSIRVKALVCDSLERIPHKWRVGTSLKTLLYAVDKEFALAINYPKGRGN